MNTHSKVILFILGVLLVCAMLFGIFTSCTPSGIAFWNSYKAALKGTDDNTKYENQKKVEVNCRSMMAQYKADKQNYDSNKAQYDAFIEKYNSTDDEALKKQYLEKANEYETFASQYKIRVNNTAATYNEFIRKNEYIWEDNVPTDIDYQLTYID